jgi:hypothetical protein
MWHTWAIVFLPTIIPMVLPPYGFASCIFIGDLSGWAAVLMATST